MPRILLVKTSSLGDVVHNLPVVSDIAYAVPGAEIEWVVEESFAAIPALHSRVAHILPVAVRRWRAHLWSSAIRQEVSAFMGELRARRYDAVIDTQGLFKSALIARAARGRRYGLDWKGSREPLSLFYDRTFDVPRDRHAVERNRSLASQALGYSLPAQIDYGVHAPLNRPPWLPAAEYAVLLHATSATSKMWPEDRWIALGRALEQRGVRSVLPWGVEQERQRSERLAAAISGAVIPARLALSELAAVLAVARCVVGVDTGLTHLAGALGARTVGIYHATDPSMTGLYGCARAANVGNRAAWPNADEVLEALERLAP